MASLQLRLPAWLNLVRPPGSLAVYKKYVRPRDMLNDTIGVQSAKSRRWKPLSKKRSDFFQQVKEEKSGKWKRSGLKRDVRSISQMIQTDQPWKHIYETVKENWGIFFKDFIYLFLEREKERKRNINVWLPLIHPLLGTWSTTQACALTGNWTSDPLVCRLALNPLSHTSQG